jgi:phosphatidylinositol alpha-1,6-mannosyltransferase
MAREQVSSIHAGRCLSEGLLTRLLAWEFRVPYLCYVQGEDVGIARTSRELTFLTRRVLERTALVIVCSHNTKRELTTHWQMNPDRVHVVHPGVDTSYFVPAARDEGVRQRLGWSGRLVVLTAGRLQARKGQDQVIRALPTVRQRFPNVLFAIVGDGYDRPRLEGLVREHSVANHVQFLGGVDDARLRECYQQCDLFVLANRTIGGDFEGFGIVLIEAQACGKPVIAGASGGTAEKMRVPETGRIVACEEPGPVAAAIVDMLRDPPLMERMGHAARVWAVANFGWEALVPRAAAIFDSVEARG